MFFTKTARVLAFIVLILAVMRIGMAVFVGTAMDSDPEAVRHYLGSSRTTGKIIDTATVWLFVAIALGTLAEISKALQLKSRRGEVDEA